MARFTSDLLDLSRLPPPDALLDINYETILAERKARLLELFTAAGIEYDVETLETDPAIVLEQTDAYHELLDLAAINSAVRAVMLAFSVGSDLEQLGALFNVRRLPGELDISLRRRIQLAPDAIGAAGSEGSYVYWALTADPRVSDAVALGPATNGLRPGQVQVSIATPKATEVEVLDIVTKKLFSKDVKPLTDMLSVRLAAQKVFSVIARIELLRGPDPTAVLAQARAALDKHLEQRRRIGAYVTTSGITAALMVSGAERVVLLSPTSDVDPGPAGMAAIDEISVTTSVVGA